MNKKVSTTLGYIVVALIGISLGALLMWQADTIKKKNKEIDSLKEELSQAKTDHFIDVVRFGQWKLQVDQLAEENGWVLPELSDSATLVVPGSKVEGHLEAEVEGDSLVVRNTSTKVVEE